MKNEELYRMMSDIDDEFITEARNFRKRRKIIPYVSALAATFACVIGLLNFNPKIAYAMGEIPVIGEFFELVTFRTFEYQCDTTYADVKIPKIKMNGLDVKYFDTIDELNHQIESDAQGYIDQILKNKSGNTGLDISYDMIENSEQYLIIRLNILQTSASGYNQVLYYHVDKIKNKIITLKDLFQKDANYVEILSDLVKEYMHKKEEQSEENFFLNDFKRIKENQNFYLSGDTLILVFDEYDITPGYVGIYEMPIQIKEIKEFIKR